MSVEFKELLMSFSIIGSICGGFIFMGELAATEILIQLGQIPDSNRKFMRIVQLMLFIALVLFVYCIFTYHA